MANNKTGKYLPPPTEIDLINQTMIDKGVSKNSLADQTGIPYKTLCRRLDGDGLLTFTEFRKIAAALNTWPSQLLPDTLRVEVAA